MKDSEQEGQSDDLLEIYEWRDGVSSEYSQHVYNMMSGTSLASSLFTSTLTLLSVSHAASADYNRVGS
jgi:hypothetical protein